MAFLKFFTYINEFFLEVDATVNKLMRQREGQTKFGKKLCPSSISHEEFLFLFLFCFVFLRIENDGQYNSFMVQDGVFVYQEIR